jgi:hypothetical protein
MHEDQGSPDERLLEDPGPAPVSVKRRPDGRLAYVWLSSDSALLDEMDRIDAQRAQAVANLQERMERRKR